MYALSISFFRILLRRKTSWLGLLAATIFIGIFARLNYLQFLYLQSQSIGGLSVFNELLLPLAGLVILCQLVLSILFGVQLLPTLNAANQANLFFHASISPWKKLTALAFPVIILAAWPLINFVLVLLTLSLQTNLDFARSLLTLLGLALINITTSLLILSVCLLVRRVLMAVLSCLALLAILLALESTLNYWWSESWFAAIFLPFYSIREGLLIYADLAGYVGWMMFAMCLCYLLICRNLLVNKAKAFGLSFISLGAILCAGLIPGEYDFSQFKRSSLSAEIVAQLSSQAEPLSLVGVIDQQTSREEIQRGFQMLQRILPATQLSFQSRQALPPELQQAGEYIQFQLGDLHQSVAYPFEQDVKLVFEAAINQMLTRKQQWLSFIEGHGEASPLGNKSSDLSQLHTALSEMGWPIAVQNLATLPLISDNTGLVIIAASKQAWLPGEVKIIIDYLNNGGNLLILSDPDSAIPTDIENAIGVNRYPGTLVDWNGYQSGTPHPAIVIINPKSHHPVTSPINSLLAFPWSSGLKAIEQKTKANVLIEPILTSHKGVWNEFDIDASELAYDQVLGEIQQPFNLAMAVTNSLTGQKIVVVGDSHFASNSALNNYANKQFMLNLISWLTNVSAIIAKPTAQQDSNIQPSKFGHVMLLWFFSLGLPILLLVLGIGYYWRWWHSIQLQLVPVSTESNRK